jgi:hypothetical protein
LTRSLFCEKSLSIVTPYTDMKDFPDTEVPRLLTRWGFKRENELSPQFQVTMDLHCSEFMTDEVFTKLGSGRQVSQALLYTSTCFFASFTSTSVAFLVQKCLFFSILL